MRISDWSSDVCSSDLVQESTADAAGAQYLSKAGISGRGSLAFFKKLQNLEFRYAVKQDDDQAYGRTHPMRSEQHTSELQSLMRISYAVFCLKKTNRSHRSLRRLRCTRHAAAAFTKPTSQQQAPNTKPHHRTPHSLY